MRVACGPRGESTGIESRGWSSRERSDADATQEPAVLGAAAERDVLAVVDRSPVADDRERRSAEAGARLEERDRRHLRPHSRAPPTALRARRHDRHPQSLHTLLPTSARTSSSRFCHDGSETREPSASDGVAAICSTHAPVRGGHREHARRAAPVEQRHQREAVLEPRERALGLERDEQLRVAVDRRAADRAAETGEVLLGQVRAAEPQVVSEVAQDVPKLERDAQIVGERRGRGAVGRLEHPEGEPADRAGDPAAVHLEVGEGLVRDPLDIRDGTVEQIAERLERDRMPGCRIGDGDEHRVGRCAQVGELVAERPSASRFSASGAPPSAMSSMRRASA